MPNKEVNNITLEIGDMIETYDLTDSNNPVIELKDTVTENATAGTEQHVFKETTADGHENQISDFLIAQKQISALRTNSTGDGLVMESYDQKATHQQTDLRLAQVTTNKNNIATAQSDIRGLQTSVSQAEQHINNINNNLMNTLPLVNAAANIYGVGYARDGNLFIYFDPHLKLNQNLESITVSAIIVYSAGRRIVFTNQTLDVTNIGVHLCQITVPTDTQAIQAHALYATINIASVIYQ